MLKKIALFGSLATGVFFRVKLHGEQRNCKPVIFTASAFYCIIILCNNKRLMMIFMSAQTRERETGS